MFNQSDILKRLRRLSAEQVESIVQRALNEADISYTYGNGGIIFNGSIEDGCRLSNSTTTFKYQEDNTCEGQSSVSFDMCTSVASYFSGDSDWLDAA